MSAAVSLGVDELPDWTGRTVAILAGGPSLVPKDIDPIGGTAWATIAINDRIWMAPWADVIYAADIPWWERNPDSGELSGLKVSVCPGGKVPEENPERRKCPEGTIFLKKTGDGGFDPRRGTVRVGSPKHTSGYQALHLAIQLGAAKVILLGYDCRGMTTKGGKPFDFAVTVPGYEALKAAAEARGCDVVNCTPGSSLVWFRRSRLEDEL